MQNVRQKIECDFVAETDAAGDHTTANAAVLTAETAITGHQGNNSGPVTDGQTAAIQVATDNERRRLLAEWRAGDESAKNRLIESLTPLVTKVARQKEWKYGHSQGEFVGQAWEAMYEALDGLFRCGHSNVGGYITIAVRRALEGDVKEESKRREVSIDAAMVEGEEPYVCFDDEEDVWEELHACCKDEDDKYILARRADGEIYAQIADELEKPRSTVHARVEAIEKRYWERNG